ncbi:conserved hypothetical protein [uncultured Eubacteriales bacterium]|uniref:DUF3298 domain-containing protein n=1 Tax=uncultured Eubacteriales bacterium TaxID=172733 RepID=A0A212JHI1_9FIRM|nr:conserved hypothetical protein [uncultured Eubacteriales bacterium]
MGRNKCKIESVNVEAGTWKQVLKCDGEPVLSFTLRWPKLPEDTAALRRIARYYRHAADRWRTRWETCLFSMACEELRHAREQSFPFRPWEAALDFTVTYNEKGLFSLYMDAYEYTGGAHGNTVRCGDAWDLNSGAPITLPMLFPKGSHWRRDSIAEVCKQIRQRIDSGDYVFLDGWQEAAASEFDPCRFYLTDEGAAVFYPLYTLAPYVEGILSFVVLPWPE